MAAQLGPPVEKLIWGCLLRDMTNMSGFFLSQAPLLNGFQGKPNGHQPHMEDPHLGTYHTLCFFIIKHKMQCCPCANNDCNVWKSMESEKNHVGVDQQVLYMG